MRMIALLLLALPLAAEQATVEAVRSTKDFLYMNDDAVSGNPLIDDPTPVYLYRRVITLSTETRLITAKTLRNRAWTPEVGATLEFTVTKLKPGANLKVMKPNGKTAKWRILEIRRSK